MGETEAIKRATRAAILAVGDELVFAEKRDTNSGWLAEQLTLRGVLVIEQRIVGDDRAAIADAICLLATQVDILLITGGLGPTDDDLTRYALGDVLDPGHGLICDPIAEAHLEEVYAARGRSMPDSNHVQSLRPRSAMMVPNPLGTAMGLSSALGATAVWCLPGPPNEMTAMFVNHVVGTIVSEVESHVELVRCFGIGESAAAMRIVDLMQRSRLPQVGTTVDGSIITARVRMRGSDQARIRVLDDADEIEQRWYPWSYGRGDATLSFELGQLLLERGESLAVAESCTGGMLAAMMVQVPGSSRYFEGGWVVYSNDMKSHCLGVPESLICRDGAVSESIAEALAMGAREQAGTDHGLAITGIAGPDGGSSGKPVGTVFISHVRKKQESILTHTRRFVFSGDRLTIRERSALSALQMMRFGLIDQIDTPLLWQVQLDGAALSVSEQAAFDRAPESVPTGGESAV